MMCSRSADTDAGGMVAAVSVVVSAAVSVAYARLI